MSALQSAAWGIPSSLQQEHAELHAELEAATRAPGIVGAAARRVATTLHPHFVREEEIALPPLALLQRLTQGPVTAEMREILPLTDALKQELPVMLREHRAIGEALDELARVARQEETPAYAELTEKIRAHALSEEQVLYPAAILVGEFVRRCLPD